MRYWRESKFNDYGKSVPININIWKGKGCFCKCVYVLVAADSIGNQLASVPDFCIVLIKFSHASMLDLCCDGSWSEYF